MNVEDLKTTYKTWLNTNDGKITLQDLEMRFHIHSPVYSDDSHETAFREGQRTVVLFLRSMVQEENAQVKQTVGE